MNTKPNQINYWGINFLRDAFEPQATNENMTSCYIILCSRLANDDLPFQNNPHAHTIADALADRMLDRGIAPEWRYKIRMGGDLPMTMHTLGHFGKRATATGFWQAALQAYEACMDSYVQDAPINLKLETAVRGLAAVIKATEATHPAIARAASVILQKAPEKFPRPNQLAEHQIHPQKHRARASVKLGEEDILAFAAIAEKAKPYLKKTIAEAGAGQLTTSFP